MNPGGAFLNSSQLFGIATEAQRRAMEASKGNPLDSRSLEPVISITFAAVALECYLSELPSLAASAPDSAISRRLSALLASADRDPLTRRVQLARIAIAGEPFDEGTAPFQDFKRLLEARNAIVHHRSTTFESVEPGVVELNHSKVLTRLPQQCLAPAPPAAIHDWLRIVSTPALADWACISALAMVEGIVNSVPPGEVAGYVVGHLAAWKRWEQWRRRPADWDADQD